MPELAGPYPAPTERTMFEAVADVLITIANGAYSIVTGVVTLRTILVVVIVASLSWLAACEIEDLDRRAYKPPVRPH